MRGLKITVSVNVRTDHFTVSCSVAWPLNESEAGGDLVSDRNLPAFLMLMMLFSCHLHTKSSKVSIKTRSTPASLSFKAQATKHTTVK